MEDVIVIGSGGHSKVIIDILLKDKSKNIIGVLDDNFESLNYDNILGIRILGKIDLIQTFPKTYKYIIAIGDNKIRKKIAKKFINICYTRAIHPEAVIGENVEILEGCVIMARTVINSYSKIGKHCILNTGSIIEHDTEIDDFVHISPRATLCGGVKIKKSAWIGAGVVIIQGMTIGRKSIVGAGSLVIRDVEDYCKVVGSPAAAIEFF